MQEYHELSEFWKSSLEEGLREDGYPWDWTTRGCFPQQSIRAEIVAKSDGVWVGEAMSSAMAKITGISMVREILPDGFRVQKGSIIARWEGPANWILALERPALNLAAFASGIATRTAKMVQLVGSSGLKMMPRITSTRKTLPGYRDLCLGAVLAGGGSLHRVSLAGGVLIKENHIAAAGGLHQAVQGVRQVAPHGLRIEVEVRNLFELSQALDSLVDSVLLDNFTPELVTQALKRIQAHTHTGVIVEVSGGITEDNLKGYLQEGVHVISVGSLTHTVQPLDLSLLVHGT